MADIFLLWVLPIGLIAYFSWQFFKMAPGPRRTYYGVLSLLLLGAMVYRHLLRGGR